MRIETLGLLSLLRASEALFTRDFCFDTSNFAAIVTRPTFVDKSLLIKVFLERDGQILVNAPHRFGKSTNMNMIKRFLEITVKDDLLGCEDVADNLTDSCRIFKNRNLKIFENKEFFYKHCGQYPVIYVDFRLLGGDTLNIVVERFGKVLYDTFLQHSYLLTSRNLNESLKSNFKHYYNMKYTNFNESDLLLGLNVLSELIFRHFKKRIVLLVDDYDLPIFDVLFDSDEQKKNVDLFFRNLMSNLLRSNPYIDKVLINACPRPTALLFVGPTRVKQFAFLERHCFTEFYGLTEREVEDLAGRCNQTEKIGQIKRSCGGYTVDGVNLYNTWAVVHYIKDGGSTRNYRDILIEEHFENLEVEGKEF